VGRDWDIAELNYNVTGDIVPDATCNYSVAGTHNGKPYYARVAGWFLWWNQGWNCWCLTPALDDVSIGWGSPAQELVGEYETTYGEASGTAIVSAGLH